jgi:hypothetical protein
VCVVLLAATLAAAGIGLILWSFFGAIESTIGVDSAAALTGLLALASAGFCAWLAQRISR